MPRAVAAGLTSAIRQPIHQPDLPHGTNSGSSHWQSVFAQERKDRRYYELLEDTLKDGFTYGYLVIEREDAICAIQPYFLLDQDLLAGLGGNVKRSIAGMRRLWPRFMYARTMMVGCVAGEGHLDGDERIPIRDRRSAGQIAAASWRAN